MLYEVITLSAPNEVAIPTPPIPRALAPRPIRLSPFVANAEVAPRITSYNVCYTKLLRLLMTALFLAAGLYAQSVEVSGIYVREVPPNMRNNFV